MDEALILNRYRPLAEIGGGGCGTVLLAFDIKMARRVAIKRLETARGGAGGRLGLAEARAAAMLNHPAIVAVHEWEATDAGALIIMEHVDGASLADVLDALDGPLDVDEAACAVDAIADALAFAHANGVLHLDLKPANVLVDRAGRVKVADFGIAALTGPDRTGRPRGGTPGYMAPEQILGQAVTETADQWAFAALVYEMLTGIVPFDADTPEESLMRIRAGRLRHPSALAPGLTPGIDLVIMRALSEDPDERYSDVGAFGQALLDHLGDPRAGRESLAEIVEDLVAEKPLDAEPCDLWDRLARRPVWATRVCAALASAWLGWVGIVPLAGASGAAAAAALCALSAALAPSLGLALGLLAMTAGTTAAFGLLPGTVVGVLATVLWASVGRRVVGAAYAPVVAAPLAAARVAPACPLALGFFLDPVPAGLGGAGAGALVTLLSGLVHSAPSSLSLPAAFVVDPWSTLATASATTIDLRLAASVAASWGIAAAVSSLGARRGTRIGASFGLFAGLALMTGALAAISPVLLARTALDLAAAAAVSAALVAAGPPPRG